MTSVTVRTFKSGNSEAIRLPKGFGFGIGTEVWIERDGKRVVLTRADAHAERVQPSNAMLDTIEAISPASGDF
ncbi:hypothetical protein GCM10007973_08030 [Polymorphobacter multimanifer]|uniref:Antitoxin VapB n=1 Tax=Polymorphobacter multimanifer TaxID=1070431 RepID=A0A841LCR2_9SPHN|nr:hypothetical protein [Polymorphobacter multimanifer]MBB6228773.1 antitoxin VapB [Polymorphobacter multimanifer]GGI73548.1 hypothetical protein GCM10007973_08030 [Polymorphobacter multimanifer]